MTQSLSNEAYAERMRAQRGELPKQQQQSPMWQTLLSADIHSPGSYRITAMAMLGWGDEGAVPSLHLSNATTGIFIASAHPARGPAAVVRLWGTWVFDVPTRIQLKCRNAIVPPGDHSTLDIKRL